MITAPERIESLPTADLVPYARNARTHSEAQVEQIAASIQEFGFTNPILIGADNGIIAGHGRVLAALRLGLERVPCVRLGHLTETQRRAYVLADNKLALNAGWDEALLAREMEALQVDEFDLCLLGFDQGEIDALLNGSAGTEGLTDPDDVPEPLPEAITKLGDVWVMGGHRLMCGDSTDAGSVFLLMGGTLAVACITDPPYSVDYEESHKIRGGDASVHRPYHEANINPSDLLEFLAYVPTDLLIFSYSVDRHMAVLCEKLGQHKWDIRKELVWVKDSFSFWMGAAYQQRHEPIWICTRNGGSFRGNVEPNQSTVLEYPRPKAHHLHPTAKPIDLWRLFVENHTNAGDIIYEPFSGSGTTVIAAEQTGRRCYAMELSPQYVDVAVRRWQQFTGKTAILESTGEPFPQ